MPAYYRSIDFEDRVLHEAIPFDVATGDAGALDPGTLSATDIFGVVIADDGARLDGHRLHTTGTPEGTATAEPGAASSALAPVTLLTEFLQSLPSTQFWSIVLHDYVGRTLVEIADALGCSHQNVSKQRKKGLESLRRHLSEIAAPELEGRLS